MDPIALILSALTAGAVAALQETVGTAIKDAYKGLVVMYGYTAKHENVL